MPIRLKLVDRYLIRNLFAPFTFITLAVCATMMMERALRLIYDMSSSDADMRYFPELLGDLIPHYLDLAVPVGFLASLILLVVRLDDHLELRAMFSAGLSLARICLPLSLAAGMVASLSLLVGGWLEPYGRHDFRMTMAQAVNSGRMAMWQSGAIYRPSDDLVLSFDRRALDGVLTGLFVWRQLPSGKELTITGRTGRIETNRTRASLAVSIDDGRYSVFWPGVETRADVIRFGGLIFSNPFQVVPESWERGEDRKEMTLTELASAAATATGSSRSGLRAELYSRIADAASILFLPCLALSLSVATMHASRAPGVILSALLLDGFRHAINLARSMGVSGLIDPLVSIPSVLLLFAALVGGIFLSSRQLPGRSPVLSSLQAISGRLGRIGRSMTAARGPGTATIGGYIIRRFAVSALAAFLGIGMVLQLADIIERGDSFVQRGIGLGGIVHYAFLALPAILRQAIPVAALVGAMSSFGGLRSSGEMIAMRAVGLASFRLVRMLLPIYLVLAATNWLLAEFVVPRTEVALAGWWAAHPDPAAAKPDTSRWFHIGGDIVRAANQSGQGTRLEDLVIFRRSPEGRVVERISADVGIRHGGRWWLHNVRGEILGDDRSTAYVRRDMAWHAAMKPGDVASLFAAPDQISSAAARRALTGTAPRDLGQAAFHTRVQRAAAEPLAPLVMLLFSVPMMFGSARRDGTWPALLYSGAAGLTYLAADGILTVWAQVGFLPVLAGAWGAPALGMTFALGVMVWVER